MRINIVGYLLGRLNGKGAEKEEFGTFEICKNFNTKCRGICSCTSLMFAVCGNAAMGECDDADIEYLGPLYGQKPDGTYFKICDIAGIKN